MVKLLNEYRILLPHEHFVEQLLVVAEKLVYRKKVRTARNIYLLEC